MGENTASSRKGIESFFRTSSARSYSPEAPSDTERDLPPSPDSTGKAAPLWAAALASSARSRSASRSPTACRKSPPRSQMTATLSIRTPTKRFNKNHNENDHSMTSKPQGDHNNPSFEFTSSQIDPFPYIQAPKASRSFDKHGDEVVLGSDDETSSLEDSLADPDELFGVREPSTSVTPPETARNKDMKRPASIFDGDEAETVDRANVKTRSMSKRTRPDSSPSKISKHTRKPLTAKPFSLDYEKPKYKWSIQRLLETHLDDAETEAGLAKLRQGYEEAEMQKENKKLGDMDEKVLIATVGESENGDARKKLLDVVSRTDALRQDKSWSFFENRTAKLERSDFPTYVLQRGTWFDVLREPASRERAFKSKFLAQVHNRIPEALLLWMLDEVALETDDSLRHEYVDVLKKTNPSKMTGIKRHNIERVFSFLGAKENTVDPDGVVELEVTSSGLGSGADWRCLISLLDVFRGTLPRMELECQTYVTSMLLRLAMDVSLMSNGKVERMLEQTIPIAIDGFSESECEIALENIGSSLFNSVVDSSLRAECLRHIAPINPRTSLFRHRLASSFLLNKRSPLSEPPSQLASIVRVEARLSSKYFDPARSKTSSKKQFDWERLAALTSILSVVVDGLTLNGTIFPSKEAKKEYNASIDNLVLRIKGIITAIDDAGASHLKRTEAKEALHVLEERIRLGVRTEPKRRKDIFDMPSYFALEKLKAEGKVILAEDRGPETITS